MGLRPNGSDDVTATPDGIEVPGWVCEDPQRRTMSGVTMVRLGLAKNVFVASRASSIQARGADASGRAVLRKTLRRDRGLGFFGRLPSCVLAI
jgi:hypothetical protein